MRRPALILLGFFIIGAFVFSSFPCGTSETSSSTVLHVGGTGPANYSSVQTAVDSAIAGDTIFVHNNTYHERLVIEKPLTLIGENKNSTIIDGDGNGFVITLASGSATFTGFTVIHSQQVFPYAGIYVISKDNAISDNILTDNFYGMQLGYASGDNRITNNTIFHNARCGIYFNHSSHNQLFGNIVHDQPFNGFGLYEFSNNNRILNNTFSENMYSGVNIRESYDNQVIGNTFIQNQVGLYKPSPEYHTITRDNIFIQNTVSLEQERDASVVTVVVFAFLVFLVFLIFRKLFS